LILIANGILMTYRHFDDLHGLEILIRVRRDKADQEPEEKVTMEKASA
jgi:hypothetical protein